MANEEKIRQDLIARFPCLADRVVVKRARRIFAEVPAGRFHEILQYAFTEQDFIYLCTITGLDEGDTLSFLYQLTHPDGTMLMLRYAAPKADPVIQTVTALFPGGALYERELVDMLGARVEGLPPGNRYPLPDDWPAGQYPLRKDWHAEMLDSPPPLSGGEKNG